MNIPTSRDLLHPMLQVAREHPRVSEGELHHFLAFQFGLYEDGPAVGGPGDLRRFACRVRVARRALLRHGLLASGGGDALIVTPQGEAYLTTGWLHAGESAVPAAPSGVAEPPSPPEPASEPEVDLKALLDEAQFKSIDLGSGWFQVAFDAEKRTWTVNVAVYDGWFYFCTHVMQLPKEPAGRSRVLYHMARRNSRMPLAKFTAWRHDALKFELQYRVEHVDAEVLASLLRMMLHVAEAEYADLARIVNVDPALQALDAAFKRSK